MKYFTIEEMCRSTVAAKRGIGNTPSALVVESLTGLIEGLLDPVREEFGRPIYVSSGYRCPALNKAVGGAANSQHTKGEAADLVTAGGAHNLIVASIIAGREFDQLILEENSGDTLHPQWVHVSYKRAGNRNQLLKTIRGKSGYYYALSNDEEEVLRAWKYDAGNR